MNGMVRLGSGFLKPHGSVRAFPFQGFFFETTRVVQDAAGAGSCIMDDAFDADFLRQVDCLFESLPVAARTKSCSSDRSYYCPLPARYTACLRSMIEADNECCQMTPGLVLVAGVRKRIEYVWLHAY